MARRVMRGIMSQLKSLKHTWLLLVRGLYAIEMDLMKIIVCPKLILSFLLLKRFSADFIGLCDFDGCDISCEFIADFGKGKISYGNLKAMLGNIQNSFYSAINTFTSLERKNDEMVGTMKLGGD